MNYYEDVKSYIVNGVNASHDQQLPSVPSSPIWQAVRDSGTELWLDTGDIEEAATLWVPQFSALTTNNTLLNKEIQKGIYDSLIKESQHLLKNVNLTPDEQILEIAFILNAWHGLRLVKIFNAKVSVELHTDFAENVDKTVEYGKRFYEICPDSFIIKVPFTAAGLIGAARLRQEGIPINFTLGFSARQNYVAALFTHPDYVNVFMGRLGAFMKDNLLGDGLNIGEKATLATQQALKQLRKEAKSTSKLIGASMRSGTQVRDLAGLDVYTMPIKVASQYANAPSNVISNRTNDCLDISIAEGYTVNSFYGDSLWDIPEKFKDITNQLVEKDINKIIPEDIVNLFSKNGFSDFMPKWSAEEQSQISADGKIPVYLNWKNQLENKKIGLDALMNISALFSFKSDQKALDERIRSIQ